VVPQPRERPARFRGNLAKTAQWLVTLAVVTGCAHPGEPSPAADRDDELGRLFAVEHLEAAGRRYEAVVPDTLDLAERARLAVNALTESLNPNTGYAPYGHAFFKVQPAYMSERMYAPRLDAGKANWGKVMEALVLMRRMCGSTQHLEIQSQSLRGMIGYVNASGCPYQNSRAIMALLELYRQRPTPELRLRLEEQTRRLHTQVNRQAESAWYEDPAPESEPTDLGIFNYVNQTHQHGGPIRALCLWHAIGGHGPDLDLAGQFTRFVVQPRFWEPEIEPRFFVGSERAHYKGHVHSYLGALLGVLPYARLTGDAWLKEFVRNGYEYTRNLGIARLGVFGETCAIAEMTILAVELSELGVADYWDHVDQYVRNHLTEMQYIDRPRVGQVVARMPTLETLPRTSQDEDLFQTREDGQPGGDTTARMLDRNLGCFFTDGGHPAAIPRANWTWTICCVGNGAKGLYHAWRSILQQERGGVQIRLLLNRASPWLDIDSYLPYEGRVVIRNKTARRIAVRLPSWVDKRAVTCQVHGRAAAPSWLDRNLLFDPVQEGEVIQIEFPVVESTETYTLKWRPEDRWFESNWPPDHWQPGHDRYICHFRGNTLVRLVPVPPRITEGPGYPLYQREQYRQNQAPMRRVVRFVTDTP
jgi:hypothetical protein